MNYAGVGLPSSHPAVESITSDSPRTNSLLLTGNLTDNMVNSHVRMLHMVYAVFLQWKTVLRKLWGENTLIAPYLWGKAPCISGPVQCKPVLFKGPLYLVACRGLQPRDSVNIQGFHTSPPSYSFPGILLVLWVGTILLPQGLVQVTLPQLNFSWPFVFLRSKHFSPSHGALKSTTHILW